MAHTGLPKPDSTVIGKQLLLNDLKAIDASADARNRVLSMETEFRSKIRAHIDSLPARNAAFAKFNTSPFVLLFYSLQHGYRYVQELEQAILPAKVFSSMETSAGRMVEEVVLPKYGWQIVPSAMHSANSALDG